MIHLNLYTIERNYTQTKKMPLFKMYILKYLLLYTEFYSIAFYSLISGTIRSKNILYYEVDERIEKTSERNLNILFKFLSSFRFFL
jgi:hypothetical protein